MGRPLGFLSRDDLLVAGVLDPSTGFVSTGPGTEAEQVHFFFLHFFSHFLLAAFRDFFTAFDGFWGDLEGRVDSDTVANCVWRQSCLTVETVS